MPRAGITADRLSHAAADLADREGLAAVSLSALARAHDVKPASLYSHVRSTDEVVVRVAVLALDELADAAEQAVAGRAGRDALVALADAHRSYAADHPGRYDAARRPLERASTPEIRESAVRAGERHARLTRAVLRGYDLGEPDETHAVRLIGSVLQGFLALEASGAFGLSRPPADESWAVVVDRLDRMLRTFTD